MTQEKSSAMLIDNARSIEAEQVQDTSSRMNIISELQEIAKAFPTAVPPQFAIVIATIKESKDMSSVVKILNRWAEVLTEGDTDYDNFEKIISDVAKQREDAEKMYNSLKASKKFIDKFVDIWSAENISDFEITVWHKVEDSGDRKVIFEDFSTEGKRELYALLQREANKHIQKFNYI